MKKHLLFATTIALTATLNAQQLLNPGFNAWSQSGGFPSYENPDNWNTLNPMTSAAGQLTATKATGADLYAGSASIKLETKNVFGQNANGIVTNGTINTTTFAIEGGVAFPYRPDSLVGYYKSQPVGADFPTMEIVLLDNNNDTIGWARFEGSSTAVTSYKRFSAPVDYMSAATPTKAIALFSSSNGLNAVAGSTLFLDDVGLIYNPTGIEGKTIGKNYKLYPNPAKNVLNFEKPFENNETISVYDITGKMVLSLLTRKGDVSIDVSSLKTGNYFYKIYNNNKEEETGKLTISR